MTGFRLAAVSDACSTGNCTKVSVGSVPVELDMSMAGASLLLGAFRFRIIAVFSVSITGSYSRASAGNAPKEPGS